MAIDISRLTNKLRILIVELMNKLDRTANWYLVLYNVIRELKLQKVN